MKLILSVLLVVFSLEVAPVIVSAAELGIRPNQSLTNEIQLFGFATDGSNLILVREFMALHWTRFESNLVELNPPKLIMGQTYFSEGRLPAGGIQRDSVYWRSVEYAYRQVLQETRDVQNVGEIEINRFVSADSGITNADEGYAAPMAVFFMSLLRGTVVDDRAVLLGALQANGRIGTITLFSEKVNLLAPHVEKILVPSGHLTLLDPTVKTELRRQRRIIQEVDTLEQAYQLMVRTR